MWWRWRAFVYIVNIRITNKPLQNTTECSLAKKKIVYFASFHTILASQNPFVIFGRPILGGARAGCAPPPESAPE